MEIPTLDTWPTTADEALEVQERMRGLVTTTGPGPLTPRHIAGLDVAYDDDTDELAAAAVVLDAHTLAVVESSVTTGQARFPYVPGLFAFREVPALITALAGLRTVPDLLVCDGQGLAHPRRFGLACHLGVLTGVPSIGVGKTPFVGTHAPLAADRGATADLVLDGDVVGRALRTRAGVKPVFVSVGHGMDLDAACAHVLRLTPRHRLPETTRAADGACREALKARAAARRTPAAGT